MKLYEVVFLVRQDLPVNQVQALTGSFKELLESLKGIVHKAEYCGLKVLAYMVQKSRKAHYVLLNIEAPFEAVKEMERQMRLKEQILRSLIVRIDAVDPKPSLLSQSHGYRENEPLQRRARSEAVKGPDERHNQSATATEESGAAPAVTSREESSHE